LVFIPFSAVAAIILGHLALSEIKKSAGRLKGQGLATAGLILGVCGDRIDPRDLIIAAIAIPNLLRAKMAANEASSLARCAPIAWRSFPMRRNARNKAIRFQLKSWDPEQAIAIVQI